MVGRMSAVDNISGLETEEERHLTEQDLKLITHVVPLHVS